MNGYFFNLVCSYSILFTAIICVIRVKRILPSFYPFVLIILLTLVNEIISTWAISNVYSNNVNANIFVLTDFLVLLWLFRNWSIHRYPVKFFMLAGITILLIWTADNFILHRIYHFNSLSRICTSAGLVLLSLDQVSDVLISERKKISRNSRFLICIAFILFNTYKVFIEVFFLMELPGSNKFSESLLITLIVLNLIANILFLLAALWMPTKRSFLLPF